MVVALRSAPTCMIAAFWQELGRKMPLPVRASGRPELLHGISMPENVGNLLRQIQGGHNLAWKDVIFSHCMKGETFSFQPDYLIATGDEPDQKLIWAASHRCSLAKGFGGAPDQINQETWGPPVVIACTGWKHCEDTASV